ncbi:hypothetical protein ACFLZV_01125 [Candidatus Margulisiibacteriota bacterium]
MKKIFSGKLKTFNIYMIFFMLLYGLLIIRTAWISDDILLTFRTILNFTHGFGPTFNIAERVQVYTHPLWFLVLTTGYMVLRNISYATLLLSFVFSLLAFWLLLAKISCSKSWITLAALGLLFSKAFIDYSTSGLENPLSYFLLALLVLLVLKQKDNSEKDLLKIVFTVSMIFLNRMDLILLTLPLLILAIYRINNIKSILKAVSLGFLPIVLWLLFSLWYYGFPFPNTFYAKLGTGINKFELIHQGFYYFLDSLSIDPITLLLITFAVVLGFIYRSGLTIALSTGIILYSLYILSIGGDFMSGRFFSVPLFGAAIILSRLPEIRLYKTIPLALLIILLGLGTKFPTLFCNHQYINPKIPHTGIADERGFYFPHRGLITANRQRFLKFTKWTTSNNNPVSIDTRVEAGGLGFVAINDGPYVHHIDICGLADPLLARLPATKKNWRIGHFHRKIPSGYQDSIKASYNLIEDKNLSKFYDKLRFITRGDLFSFSRFMIIIKMNLGLYDHLIEHVNSDQIVTKKMINKT